MCLVSEDWNEASYPGFQPFKPDQAVVGFASLVIGPSDDQVVGRAGTRLQADIIVRIERVPVERVGHVAARNAECHRIGSVRNLLGVDRRFVVVDR